MEEVNCNYKEERYSVRENTHDLVDLPIAFKGFDHLDRSLHNNLNIGEVDFISSETVRAW